METYVIKDRETWETWLNDTNCDVYDHFDYVQANCCEGESPELFVAKHEQGMLVYPYIRRRIDDTYEDLVTAYGYGGPFRVGVFTDEDVVVARKHFLDLPVNRSTVTETIRYHPIRTESFVKAAFGTAVPIRKTVHVRLDDEYEQLEKQFHKMTRRNVRRAHRDGVSLKVGGQGDLHTFLSLYETTMVRKGANEDYFFSEAYFNQLFDCDLFEAEFLFAVLDEQIIAGVFVLYGKEGAHYHLGGSNKSYLSFRPNHFLFSEMIRRARDKGKRHLHFGGGATGDDALYDFKQSFSGESPLSYCIGQAVLIPDMYQRLNQRHIQMYGPSDFFPIYRSPIETSEEFSQIQ